MSKLNRRLQTDFIKLKLTGLPIDAVTDCFSRFYITIPGPEESPYRGQSFRLRVVVPPDYPFKSPSVGFVTKIWHPNICSSSGTICLDVINQTWSPLFNLTNVFVTFIPQLLTYPNAKDPLNATAARQWLFDRAEFERNVQEYAKMGESGLGEDGLPRRKMVRECDGHFFVDEGAGLGSLDIHGANDEGPSKGDPEDGFPAVDISDSDF